MPRNDFWAGFLQGLYQGGVGNPEVNYKRRENDLNRQFTQAQLDLEARKQGLVPDTGIPGTSDTTSSVSATNVPRGTSPAPTLDQGFGRFGNVRPNQSPVTGATPATPTAPPSSQPLPNAPGSPQAPVLHPDHPMHAKTRSFVKNLIAESLFPGSTGPNLNTAYKADTNAPSYYQLPSGEVGMGTPPPGSGAIKIPAEHGMTILSSQEKRAPQNATLVYGKDGKPRIEKSGYVAKEGELTQPTDLGTGLTKIGTYQGQEGRAGFYGARETQIGAQMRDEFQKAIDPSEIAPTSVVGRAAQSVKRIVNGETLLSKNEVVTQAKLQAALGDLDTVVSQASATIEGRKMMASKNFYNEVKQLYAYLSSNPGDVKVPDNYVDMYRDILKDLGPIAQKTVHDFIDRSYKFKKNAYKNTIMPEEMDDVVQSTKDSYDIKKLINANKSIPAQSGAQQIGRFKVEVQ